jgi:ABC-type nitrate/sulfonate/bicarbonate transport system permease component
VTAIEAAPATVEVRRPPRRAMARLMAVLPTTIAILVIAVGWELFPTLTGQPDYVVPPLSSIVAVGWDRALSTLLPNALVTLQEILLGFALGVTFGILLGAVIFFSLTMRRALLPLIIATQAIPVIAIAPILVIWFGFGILPKIFVAALISFFPVAMNTIAGLGSVERESVNLMRSLGASRRQILLRLRLPAALPSIFTGVKNAAAISAIGAIVGEWVGSNRGLGPVMITANASFKTSLVFAAIGYLSIMSIALFLLVVLAERLIIPWHFLTRDKRH